MNRILNIIILILAIIIIFSILISIYAWPDSIITNQYMPIIKTRDVYLHDNHSLSFNNYYEYHFNKNMDSFFQNNNYYGKVLMENIPKYKEYFEDIFRYFDTNPDIEKVTFNENIISENDYIYIQTLEGKKRGENSVYGKFDCYSVYYYDSESCKLYYIDRM